MKNVDAVIRQRCYYDDCLSMFWCHRMVLFVHNKYVNHSWSVETTRTDSDECTEPHKTDCPLDQSETETTYRESRKSSDRTCPRVPLPSPCSLVYLCTFWSLPNPKLDCVRWTGSSSVLIWVLVSLSPGVLRFPDLCPLYFLVSVVTLGTSVCFSSYDYWKQYQKKKDWIPLCLKSNSNQRTKHYVTLTPLP